MYITVANRLVADRPVNLPAGERSLATILAAMVADDARHKGIEYTRWGDKTPFNFRVMNEILFMFPDARFVHSYRDGCDVVQSRVREGLTNYRESARFGWIR